MKNIDMTETVNKTVGYLLSFAGAVITIALTVLSVILIAKYKGTDPNEQTAFVTILSMIISFVIFFGVISFRIIITNATNQRELMSIKGWRLLAIIF